ncbi:hypothetical protein JCM16303_000859 [Sporobolomyces ruberrimus]
MRRLIVCCDGTWESELFTDDARRLTNIARIYAAIEMRDSRKHPAIEQLKLYVEGVGTGEELLVGMIKGASGSGVLKKVREAYFWICSNYELEDEVSFLLHAVLTCETDACCLNQVHLFGFSRGAYIVRLVASLISRLGFLQPKSTLDLFPRIFALLCDRRDVTSPTGARRNADLERLVNKTREGKSKQVGASEGGYLVRTLGLFETVPPYRLVSRQSSTSVDPGNPFSMSDHILEPEIRQTYQALALGEDRPSFTPIIFEHQSRAINGGTISDASKLSQVWFPGSHKDVGGGYEQHDLASLSLAWLVSNVKDDLSLDLEYLKSVLKHSSAPWGSLRPHHGGGRFLHHVPRPIDVDPGNNRTFQWLHSSVLRQQPRSLPHTISSLLRRDPSRLCAKMVWWIVGAASIVFAIVLAIFRDTIVEKVRPQREAIIDFPFSWIFPLLLIVFVSATPFTGRTLVLMIVGLIWDLQAGLAIATVGVLLGEALCFFVFKSLFAEKAAKIERRNAFYASVAKSQRNSGVIFISIVRYSFLPGRFVAATQSISGMPFWKFMAGVVLSMPKQLSAVWLGALIAGDPDPTKKDHHSTITIVILAVTMVAGVIALYEVYWRSRRYYQLGRSVHGGARGEPEESVHESSDCDDRQTRSAQFDDTEAIGEEEKARMLNQDSAFAPTARQQRQAANDPGV